TLGDLLELSGGLVASVAAVADDYDRLSVPLLVEVIERIFKRGGMTPVVLRGDEHNGVSTGDLAAPGARMLLSIGAQLRDAGLIVHRQWPVGQVHQLVLKVGRCLGDCDHP